MTRPAVYQLQEYQPFFLPASALSLAAGEKIWHQFQPYFALDFPSPKTNNRWCFTSLGWVGTLPITPDLTFVIQPKVPLDNLWAMLDVAYGFSRWAVWPGLAPAASSTTADWSAQLATLLAERVCQLVQEGVYVAYQPRQELVYTARGRVDVGRSLLHAPAGRLVCHDEQPTSHNPLNQILAYTLHLIAQSGVCQPAGQHLVRRALAGLPPAPTRPFTPADLDQLTFHRLTERYRPLMALCRFFLAHHTPHLQTGRGQTLPFLVNMETLFEQFVAAWFTQHLPPTYHLKIQPRLTAGRSGGIQARPDMVIYDQQHQPVVVIDTKYKTPSKPALPDVYQVAFYASQLLPCPQAVLLYPQTLAHPLVEQLPLVKVHTLAFHLTGRLQTNGEQLLQQLGLLPTPY